MKKLFGIISTFLIIVLTLVLAASCKADQKTGALTHRDYWPTKDWLTSTPEAQEMDSVKLERMMTAIEERDHSVDSVLIVRNGYIVWEEYPNDILYDRNMPHVLYSVTKSVTSALVGIAISKGYIKSVDQRIVDFFPDKTIANLDERKRNITIENLLMMTSGFEWNEISYGYSDPRNSVAQALASGDYVQYVLDRPMAYQPGETFVYNTGNTQVLSAIIAKVTSLSTDTFAQKYLFEPIGITSSYWNNDAQDIPLGGSGLELTPRDAAKFGYLFLNNGVWDGKQIVPADWVTRSTSNTQSIYGNYGYLWWINPLFDYYNASGLYGQRIFVAPQSDLICVITTSKEESSFVDQTFIDYVLASLSTSKSK